MSAIVYKLIIASSLCLWSSLPLLFLQGARLCSAEIHFEASQDTGIKRRNKTKTNESFDLKLHQVLLTCKFD